MKIYNNLIFLLLSVISSLQLDAQISFSNLSFDMALSASKQTGKVIFLQFESVNCNQCNEVADKAFNDIKLGELVNATLIPLKITADHPDRNKIAATYNKSERSFGTIFLTGDGTLIHNYSKTSSQPKSYEEEIDKALYKAGEGIRISSFQSQYKSGNRNLAFLEEYMLARKTLRLDTDSLLNEYVTLLPQDSLKSVRTLLFIAEMAPVLNSKADSSLRKHYYSFIEAWNKLSGQKRIATNALIVYKSMNKAISEKNESYAYQVADFRKRTYSSDPKGGQQASEKEMIRYYLETKDTLNYLIRSVYFYDNYFMTIKVDSIKTKDSLNRKALFEKAPITPVENGGSRKVVQYSPITQYYNRELNNAASAFYEMTNDPLYIAKAIKWSERANIFFESYISMNTHALLLYKAGKKEDAILWKKKAIEQKKKMGFDTRSLEKELSEMN